jgi:hypothetical protein
MPSLQVAMVVLVDVEVELLELLVDVDVELVDVLEEVDVEVVVGRQTIAEQALLVQSELTMQPCPGPHGGQVPPPQSMSVSVPFCMPSVQVAMVVVVELEVDVELDEVLEEVEVELELVELLVDVEVVVGRQTMAEHALLVQSALTLQPCPGPHGGQEPPPQSTSVSVPFWMPSVQVATVVVVELELVVEVDEELLEVDVVVDVVVDEELVLTVVDVLVVVVVVGPGHGPGTPFLSFKLKARPPACTLCWMVLPLPVE